MSELLTSRRIEALGTYVDIAVAAPEIPEALFEQLDGELDLLDRTVSCWRKDSEVRELFRLTTAQSTDRSWYRVSGELLSLLDVALWSARATNGLVDPTIGARMVDFRLYPAELQEGREPTMLPAAVVVQGYKNVEIDMSGRRVRLPRRTLLDLHSISKGVWADRLAARFSEAYSIDVLVSMGGDLAVCSPGGTEFPVAVPWDASSVFRQGDPVVSVREGALATSSSKWRRWEFLEADGEIRHLHHIIDPRTGDPSTSEVASATVVAHRAGVANAYSLAAVVGGREGVQLIADAGLPARIITNDGHAYGMGGWVIEPPSAPEHRRGA